MESLALRYANALLSIALEENNNKTYREHVKSIYDTLQNSEDLQRVLKSAFISKKEKLDLFETLLKDEDLIYVKDFILVIIKNSRETHLIEILNEFIRISNLEDGIIEGIIYSVEFLSSEQIDNVSKAIEKKINKKVVLKNRIDNTLIGGIKVVVDDYNFDGSIKDKLRKLNQYLKEGN